MPTLRFTLTWPDGATVTATVTAAHPNDEAAVDYAGAHQRLPHVWERCAVTTLRAIFEQAAATPSARLNEWQSAPWPDENDVAPPRPPRRASPFR